MVKRQAETLGDFGLNLMHIGAILGHWLAGFSGGQFGGRAVLIRCAEEQNLITARPVIACEQIRRQLAAHKVSKVFDPVDIRNG